MPVQCFRYNAGQLQRTALLAKSRISLFDKLQEAFANIAQHYRQAATSTQSLSDALVVLKKATASFLEVYTAPCSYVFCCPSWNVVVCTA